MKKSVLVISTMACLLLLGAVTNPAYFSSLVVGGGYGSSPDGGLTIEDNGHLHTDGDINVDGAVNSTNLNLDGNLMVQGTATLGALDVGGPSNFADPLVLVDNLDDDNELLRLTESPVTSGGGAVLLNEGAIISNNDTNTLSALFGNASGAIGMILGNADDGTLMYDTFDPTTSARTTTINAMAADATWAISNPDGTYEVNVSLEGDLAVSGAASTGAATVTASAGEVLTIRRDTSTANNLIRQLWQAKNSSAAYVDYGQIAAEIVDNTASAHTGLLRFNLPSAGTLTERARITNSGLSLSGNSARTISPTSTNVDLGLSASGTGKITATTATGDIEITAGGEVVIETTGSDGIYLDSANGIVQVAGEIQAPAARIGMMDIDAVYEGVPPFPYALTVLDLKSDTNDTALIVQNSDGTYVARLAVEGRVAADNLRLSGIPTYADNAAATSGGLSAGDVYRTSTGQLMIRY